MVWWFNGSVSKQGVLKALNSNLEGQKDILMSEALRSDHFSPVLILLEVSSGTRAPSI